MTKLKTIKVQNNDRSKKEIRQGELRNRARKKLSFWNDPSLLNNLHGLSTENYLSILLSGIIAVLKYHFLGNKMSPQK